MNAWMSMPHRNMAFKTDQVPKDSYNGIAEVLAIQHDTYGQPDRVMVQMLTRLNDEGIFGPQDLGVAIRVFPYRAFYDR